MSGFKPPELQQFFRSLHAREMDVSKLATVIGVSRPALTRVLNGGRRRGPIWARAVRHLTPREVELLDVAHSSTWNARRVEKRPKWSAVAAELAGKTFP